MTEAEILAALRVLLAPRPLGKGPIRIETLNEWTREEVEAYEALRHAADLPADSAPTTEMTPAELAEMREVAKRKAAEAASKLG